MFSWRNGVEKELPCPHGPHMISVKDVVFMCSFGGCPLRDKKVPGIKLSSDWDGYALFRPEKYGYSVKCPYGHEAFEKICPEHGRRLPLATGQSETIGIIGASSSGKTCYIAALIRQIRKELGLEEAGEFSLEWNDDEGQKYFTELEHEIFRKLQLPGATSIELNVASVQISIRFDIRRRWKRFREGPEAVVPLVFYDPAGEFFQPSALDEGKIISDVYFLHYLRQARAIILIVDPFSSEDYWDWLEDNNYATRKRPKKITSTATALGIYVKAIRDAKKQRKGKLDRDLAVVFTKCDEPGMFDPDDPTHQDRFPAQGENYDPQIAEDISNMVVNEMRKWGMQDAVALARKSFRRVGFFAASALGKPPAAVTTIDEVGDEVTKLVLKHKPFPRRVEEPLLWILHQWGYI